MINQLESLTLLEKAQIEQATILMKECLKENLIALYLYGSAVESGLTVHSDIDLLLVINQSLSVDTRTQLMSGLLEISAYPLSSECYRALEVTAVTSSDIDPWCFPAKRELQFGEWLRESIQEGDYGYAEYDADLTILLTQARNQGIALIGKPAIEILPQIPHSDLLKTLQETMKLWQNPADLVGDERNIMLTISRILYSQVEGGIISKREASQWLLPQLPIEYVEVLQLAMDEYQGLKKIDWSHKTTEVERFIHYTHTVFNQYGSQNQITEKKG